jgi:hypothetical protein
VSGAGAPGHPDHPRGATACAGAYTLDTPLFGGPEEAVWEGRTTRGEAVLITLGLPVRVGPAELRARLGLPVAGVVPLLDVGTLDGSPDTVVIVEAHPAGVRSDEAYDRRAVAAVRAADAWRLGAAVGRIVLGAHAAGRVVAGVRPDAVWLDAADIGAPTALAPRAATLWALRGRTDAGVMPGHAMVVASPEIVLGADPVCSDDAFALAVSTWWWATGRHPTGTSDHDAQVLAIGRGAYVAPPGPPGVRNALRSALARRADRPTVADLVAVLAGA